MSKKILCLVLVVLAALAAAPVASAFALTDDEEAAAVDVLEAVVPTGPVSADCPAGTEQVYFEGEPVVADSDGTPVCATPAGNGAPGETVPGQPGEDGGSADSEGVLQPGEAGEVPF